MATRLVFPDGSDRHRPALGPRRGPRPDARARRPPRRRRPRAPGRSADEPAHLGPRPHRRLRGPVGRASPRAGSTSCTPSSPRSTTRSRRRARCAARSSCSTPTARARTSPTCASGRVAAAERHGIDPVIHEMVLRHELQHTETMRQAMRLGGAAAARASRRSSRSRGRDAWVDIPGGAFAMGARGDGFAFDNELPRHRVELAAVPHRAPPRHQRDVDALHRGRRLRAPRVVERRGLGLEGGRGHHRLSGRSRRAPRRTRVSRVLVRGRRLRPLQRGSTAHGGRVGAGGDLGPDATSPPSAASGSGPRAASAATPASARSPYREYSEVFFGDDYRVLRGGSWATHPRVGTATFRNWDLPQRRQIFAGLRLAHDSKDVPMTVETRPGRRALARRRRARRAHAPVQGAAAQALLRRARRRAVRPDLRAARVLPDARGALDPRGAQRGHRRGAPAPASSSSSARARRRRRACCCAAMADAGTLTRYVPVDVTEHMVQRTADELVEEFPGLRVARRRRRLRAATSTPCPRPTTASRGSSRCSAARSATSSPGSRRQLPALDRRAAAPRRRPPAARDRPRQGPGGHRGRLQRRGRRHRRVQQATSSSCSTASWARTSTSTPSSTYAFFDREREWIEMRLRATRRMDVRVEALDLDVVLRRRARSCAPRSARSSRASASRATWPRPASSSREVLTDDDGLFALSLSARPG